MSGFKFELNRAAVGRLLKSSEMASVLEGYGERVLSNCPSDKNYVTHPLKGYTRTTQVVAAADMEACIDNDKHNTLIGALR